MEIGVALADVVIGASGLLVVEGVAGVSAGGESVGVGECPFDEDVGREGAT